MVKPGLAGKIAAAESPGPGSGPVRPLRLFKAEGTEVFSLGG